MARLLIPWLVGSSRGWPNNYARSATGGRWPSPASQGPNLDETPPLEPGTTQSDPGGPNGAGDADAGSGPSSARPILGMIAGPTLLGYRFPVPPLGWNPTNTGRRDSAKGFPTATRVSPSHGEATDRADRPPRGSTSTMERHLNIRPSAVV